MARWLLSNFPWDLLGWIFVNWLAMPCRWLQPYQRLAMIQGPKRLGMLSFGFLNQWLVILIIDRECVVNGEAKVWLWFRSPISNLRLTSFFFGGIRSFISFRHHGRGVHPIHVIWIRVGFVNLLCFTDFSNLTKCTWFSFRVDTRKRFGFRDISYSGIFRDLKKTKNKKHVASRCRNKLSACS